MKHFLSSFFIASALTMSSVFADCSTITISYNDVNIDPNGYNPFDPNAVLLDQGNFTLINNTGTACNATLRVTQFDFNGSSAFAGTATIENASGGSNLASTDAPNNTVNFATVNIPASGSQTVTFNFRYQNTNPNQVITSSSPFIDMLLDLYDGSQTFALNGANIAIDIPEVRNLSISQGGATNFNAGSTAETINLDLSTSRTPSNFNVIAQATDNYKITVESQNGGSVCISNDCTDPHHQIQYDLTAGGNSVVFAGANMPVSFVNSATATNINGQSYPVTIQRSAGQTEKRAGTYTDMLTFTISNP